ncbi:FGGY family carbohydrate kinase [Saccharophagus degradans]|uniref:FGGY family carbohydrate kinase n=1 Tax=Saccharophagus degradans TaxID=86304 RepID=UPI0024782A38|nr:FGGY family carbohydrate kinase [Saccharophagus degradans]WGO97077.1 FGGY family carbohydrate kinase [Saccharophagus degradans]
MSENCILSIDIGTHSTRVAIINTRGQILWLKSFSYTLHYINEAFIEQDAWPIVEQLKGLIDEATQTEFSICAAGIACQRSTVLAWDSETGKPLHAALSWMDTRAKGEVTALARQQKAIKQKTGLVLSPHYGATKLAWLQRHLTEDGERVFQMGPLISFVLFHLVAGRPFICDESNAARTQLYDIYTRNWSLSLKQLFGVGTGLLPQVLPCCANYGNIMNARGKSIPLVAVSGDQNAAYFALHSLGVFRKGGAVVANLGTGAFLLVETHLEHSPSNLLHTLLYSSEGSVQYALEATINGAGSAVEWLCEQWIRAGVREGANTERDRDQFFKELALWFERYQTADVKIPVFINTLGGVAAPYWRQDIPHNFIGVSDSSSWFAKAMAVFESIAFWVRRNVEEIEASRPVKLLVVSGGLLVNNGFRQMLANAVGKKVVVNTQLESTLVGAAGLAFAQLGQSITVDDSQTSTVYTPIFCDELEERYQTFKHYLDNY